MYPLARRWLFRLDPEQAHALVLNGLRVVGSSLGALRLLDLAYGVHDRRLQVRRFGLTFRSPIGLAAGLDKDGVAVPALAALGFGSLELGTVTARAQEGNARPRLFRLVSDEALINRMGFNNLGAEALAARLAAVRRRWDAPVPVGINVGKSRDAPLDRAVEDYDAALRAVWGVADYVALNVSSPNTPGLRSLQEPERLAELLDAAAAVRTELGWKPILLKIAPELDGPALAELVAAAQERGVDGLIATNTTTARNGLANPAAAEDGGLSGLPLRRRSLQVLRELRAHTDLPLISVGGVTDGADVVERLRAGASLVQLYTSFIYRGPALLREMAHAVTAALSREGLTSVEELIGRSA